MKKIKFTQIFNDTIKLYPERIYIGDGGKIGSFDCLDDINDTIEEEEHNLKYDIYSQMLWVIRTHLKKLAIKKFDKNEKFIYKYDIDLNSVHKRFYDDYIKKESLLMKKHLGDKEAKYVDDFSKDFMIKWKKHYNPKELTADE